jgi:uncharacterized glyoxalase superfamily protein PhnB
MVAAFSFERIVPILRIFSVEKAKEFYCGFLGCTVDWEHRYEDGMPLYMQVSRSGLVLHLSEHHGDCCPGASIEVQMTGIDGFHKEISTKGYRYYRPSIEEMPWNARVMAVTDPFGNRVRFTEVLRVKNEKPRTVPAGG